MTSATLGIGAIECAILSVVREAIGDETEVQFVAKLLRQVFVDGKTVAEVTEGRCVSTGHIESFVNEIKQVLATTAAIVKKEKEEPSSEMDLPSQSDDELSLELGLEDTDTTTGSSAAMPSSANGQLQPEPKSFGKAITTPDGCVAVESKRYPGVVLQFRLQESRRGRKPTLGASYHCSACVDQFKSWGIVLRPIFVANGEIIGRDPDCAGTSYGHLCQLPERVAELEEKFAARRLSERKRSAPVRLHDASKTDNIEGQEDASAAPEPQKDPASSKPSGPPRKRRRETTSKADNNGENKAASGDATPRLAKRSGPELQVKNGNVIGLAPGQPSNNAQYIRKVKAEVGYQVAETKNGGGKAEEPRDVAAPADENGVHIPALASKEDADGSAAAPSKAAAYAANFGMAVKTADPSVVQYENIFGDNYTFKLVQEKQVTKNGVAQTVRTYRCQGCMNVKARDLIKGDVPLVKTIDDEFVERDPDHPLGNKHLCIA